MKTWVGLLIGAGIFEGYAYRGKKQPTLSMCTRHWLGIDPKRRHGRVSKPLLAALLLWFYGHIIGWWW